MGIGPVVFEHLAELSTRWRPDGPSVMLGRQAFRLRKMRGKTHGRFARALRRSGAKVPLDAMVQPDGYSETMFRSLGFGDVQSLDMADHEGAAIAWNLNDPVPRDWHKRFDFIFDGGTLEHVFDVPQSFANVRDMLRPGGRFVSVTPFNGFPGHGFYQFSPELIWTYWRKMAGCVVHACRAIHLDGRYAQDMPDPSDIGKRVEPRVGPAWRGGMPSGRVALWSEIEKTDTISEQGTKKGAVQQSDYVARWSARADGPQQMEPT